MQLNEIIEENTLVSIGNRTRLSYENLEQLFKRDFSGFRKVQALGFISILEREYRADLSQLRAECLAYFDEERPLEEGYVAGEAHRNPPHKSSTVLDMSMERKPRSVIKPILTVLVGAGLLYAAWLTYTSSKMGDAMTNPSGENGGFFTSIMRQAHSWMGGTSDNEIAGTDAVSMERATGEANQSGDAFVIAGASEKTKDVVDETLAVKEKQTVSDTVAVTQEETPSANSSTAPTNTDEAIQQIGDALAAATDEASDATTDKISGTTTDEATTDASAPLATEVPSVSSEAQGDAEGRSLIKEATERALKDVQEAKAKQEEAARKQAEEAAAHQKAEEEARQIAAEEKARQEQAARERAAQKKAAREKAAKMGVVFQPRKKVWLGIVDLLTMKRTTAVTKNKMTFKKPKGKWIVATGHGRITFKIGDKETIINDGKKHFLLIQNGSVKEIPHTTFQKLNKSKVW